MLQRWHRRWWIAACVLQLSPLQCGCGAGNYQRVPTYAQVRLLALDFDLTLVSIHTNGTWTAGAAELRDSLRPLFCSLIPAVQQQGIFVSVVTFSGQTDLIQECLAHAAGSAERAAAIIVRGEDGSWDRTPGPGDPDSKLVLGKQQHLRSCCDEVERQSGHRPASSEGARTASTLCTICAG
jgi:hypothetical protein